MCHRTPRNATTGCLVPEDMCQETRWRLRQSPCLLGSGNLATDHRVTNSRRPGLRIRQRRQGQRKAFRASSPGLLGLQQWRKLGPREGKGVPAITEPASGSQPLLQGHLTLGLLCLSGRQS